MANTKSAIKRIRRISKQTAVNKARKSRYKNALKKMNSLIEAKKKSEALKFLPKLNSELMKIAKTGIVKKQNATRNVSRFTKKIASNLFNSIINFFNIFFFIFFNFFLSNTFFLKKKIYTILDLIFFLFLKIICCNNFIMVLTEHSPHL